MEILSDSLQIPETAPPVKIARLMVVSDLLHNTGKAPVKEKGKRAAAGSAAPQHRQASSASVGKKCSRGISGVHGSHGCLQAAAQHRLASCWMRREGMQRLAQKHA